MRTIKASEITATVRQLCMDANFHLGEDVLSTLKRYEKAEESPLAKDILKQIIQNADIAHTEEVAMCQDTGFAVTFVELGEEVRVEGGSLNEAIHEGIRQGYKDGYLRKSIVEDPLRRKNTGDNTPGVIHLEMVPGDKIKLIVAPKGGGSENMSEVKMMKPADGVEGLKEFVVDRVRRSGGNPCPPIIVGVGVGGTFEKCAYLAKKALLRELGSIHPDPYYADLEKELLEKVNNLGVGPQGLGGRTTALGLHIEAHPCHIASFPVSVNLNCHAARHKEAII
ncbi:MAG: fumarate hydratase [candidate division Zixibacteria bacterium]|nr:fumarate hydratase [candidate division Zixibacteria bacterium]